MSGRGFGHNNKRLFKGIISDMIVLVLLVQPVKEVDSRTPFIESILTSYVINLPLHSI